MKAIFLLFDSLNRRALSCYGNERIHTPNFARLAERAVTFDTHYVGSLPCMPARRDFHTGRLNFLHRSWGPLEPFDQSFARLLTDAGQFTHLISDHYHYWEEGGCTYHTRYNTWEFIRGQEADPWVAMVQPPLERFRAQFHPSQVEEKRTSHRVQHLLNRGAVLEERDFPSVQCFDSALRFLEQNHAQDGWLLQVETFDPHEPYHAPAKYRERYPTDYVGPILEWPRYRKDGYTPPEMAELNANYAALVSLCDAQLGRLLDLMDARNLWADTALFLTTDHGFLLGERDWWGKNRMPMFNEIANTPCLVYHPDFAAQGGTRRTALTHATDLMPTVLDCFGLQPGPQVEGRSLLPLLSGEQAHHEAVLYGTFGGAVNITDGRYTYFHYPKDILAPDFYEYTLMPTHMNSPFSAEELRRAELHAGFRFTDGMRLLRIPALPDARRPPMHNGGFVDTTHQLYDLQTDPMQERPLDDPATAARLHRQIVALMQRNEAPPELYPRFGLEAGV